LESFCDYVYVCRPCINLVRLCCVRLFFFACTASPEIYSLSLHDALPIYPPVEFAGIAGREKGIESHRQFDETLRGEGPHRQLPRSEEHTSELQSRENLVCRLLLEKKKKRHRTSGLR